MGSRMFRPGSLSQLVMSSHLFFASPQYSVVYKLIFNEIVVFVMWSVGRFAQTS